MNSTLEGESSVSAASYRTVLRNPSIRVLVAARATSKMAASTISYGAMVHLARLDASQFQIALVSSSSYLGAVLFGFQGGTAADSLSKRVAVAGGHAVLAVLCFLIPVFLGTGVGDLMLLMFLSSVIMQVVSPGLKAATTLVAALGELATASALLSVVGSVASGIGSAFIAPVLIKTTNIEVVLYTGGVLYALGAIRALKLPSEEGRPRRESLRELDWRPRALSLRQTAERIIRDRGVATMILVGAVVVALFEAFNTLIPRYVGEVLGEDPANSVFIFAPAGIGLLIGTLYAPRLIARYGERRLAVVALIVMSAGMVALGLIEPLAPLLAPFSPLRLLELFGLEISDEILAASLVSIPLNFGSTISGATVLNFINRTVPIVGQGATFGVQEVEENLLTIVAVLTLGIIATILGPRVVMVVAPIVVIAVVLWLLRYSYRSIQGMEISRREAWEDRKSVV